MDNDLERSVRLLEDALHTPTEGLFKMSTLTPKREKLPNLSMTFLPSELGLDSTPKFYDTMLLLTEDKSITGSVIQGSGPWKNTVDNLCIEFADVLQDASGGLEVLAIAEGLARCCSDALAVVQSLKSKVAISELPEEQWLESERNNWRLLYILYNDRLNFEKIEQDESLERHVDPSEKNCVRELYRREHLIRESQLVIDWLERIASERDDPILHQSDWTYGWEHTLHQLVAADSIAIGSSLDTIKNIHPDAPHFQHLSLHHLDNVNDKKLCQRIFMEIRSGNLEGAQELCYNSGQPWRSAILEGWKLYHNPNRDNDQDFENDCESDEEMEDNHDNEMIEEYQDTEGNSNRDLWKTTAIDYCKEEKLDVYERATVAALCGYLESTLPVCTNWEDYLWAYMRTMVDIRVESEIRDSILKDYKPLPEEYWEQKRSLCEIFTLLECSNNAAVAREAKQIDRIIQKHIILDEIPKLITLLDNWSKDPDVSTYSLRFFAHLVLFFENVGGAKNRKICENILEKYISRLSDMNETQLVAFYVSKLTKRKQIVLYAQHCEKILLCEDRQAALSYAEEFSLDVFATTKCIVESISAKPSNLEISGNLQHKLTKADEMKISALDWLLFYEEHRTEALRQTNALIFKFLTLGKSEAAQLALNKIPHDSVAKIRSEGEMPDEINQIINSYCSFKAYLDAHEAFNEWFRQYRNKPTPPADLPETAEFTEKVAHNHKVSQFNAETERWKLTTSHAAKTAKTLLYNVLLFPLGWLVEAEDAEHLRSICIPEVVLLLYSILNETGAHGDAVQLADLVAAEKYGLYKLFQVYSKEKLGEILEKICRSSVALLNAKQDPFGNPLNRLE